MAVLAIIILYHNVFNVFIFNRYWCSSLLVILQLWIKLRRWVIIDVNVYVGWDSVSIRRSRLQIIIARYVLVPVSTLSLINHLIDFIKIKLVHEELLVIISFILRIKKRLLHPKQLFSFTIQLEVDWPLSMMIELTIRTWYNSNFKLFFNILCLGNIVMLFVT